MQATAGGDALIGRRLHPLLSEAGFGDVVVEPRTVYADRSRPSLVDGFTRNTFIAMVESAREASIRVGLMSEAEWNQGIADLERTAEEGTFHYAFFKATALAP